MDPDLLLALATHPAVLALGAVAGVLFVAALARAQVAQLGLDEIPLPGISRFRWSALVGGLVLWGLAGVALSLWFPAALPAGLLGLLARVGASAGVLWVASWAVKAREEAARDLDREAIQAVERQRGAIILVGAAGAVLAFLGAGGGLLLLAVLLLGGWALLQGSGPATERLVQALRTLAAGVEVRQRLRAGSQKLLRDGQPIELLEASHPLCAQVMVGGSRRRMGHSEVLALLDRGSERTTAGDPG